MSEFIEKPTVDCFETLLAAADSPKINEAAQSLAENFSLSESFKKLICGGDDERSAAESKHLSSFFRNLNLLVEKTWVEKNDEVQKRQVLDSLRKYQECFARKEYRQCYPQFFQIIRSVMSLMFGVQSQKDDFLDYAMRIDPEIGLFWWYVCNLPRGEAEISGWSDEKIRVVLLVPMFFLANY